MKRVSLWCGIVAWGMAFSLDIAASSLERRAPKRSASYDSLAPNPHRDTTAIDIAL